MYKLILVILVSMLTLAGCGGQNQETAPSKEVSGQQPVQEELEKIVTTLDINQANNKITFELHVENNSDQAMKLVFSSGKKYEIKIRNEEGAEIYDSSKGKMYTQAIQELQVKPHEKTTWKETWQPDNLKSGTYKVEAAVTASQIEGGDKEKLRVSKTFKVQ